MKFQTVVFLCSVLSSVVFGKNARIIGGSNAEINDFPYMASFRYTIPNLTFCGGAIISHNNILTAAHCLYDDERRFHMIRIYTGVSSTHSLNGPTFEIDRVVYHPEYTAVESLQEMNHNDICIVWIKGAIIFDQFQNKISLPVRDVYHLETAVLTGWGMRSYPTEIPPTQLQKLTLTIFHNDFCKNIIPRELYSKQFCAMHSVGVGPCSGDSGSPLVIRGQVVGIVSFNLPCATGIPDIYTRVYSYLDFIGSASNAEL